MIGGKKKGFFMSWLNKYFGLLLFFVLIVIGYLFAAYKLGFIIQGLETKSAVLFIIHMLAIALFAFFFRNNCKRKSLNKSKTLCARKTIHATILFVFFTEIIIIFVISL
jgi:hypothetical protein